MSQRRYSLVDRFIGGADRALRTLAPGGGGAACRKIPEPEQAAPPLADRERRHAAGLMRVNHSGEVCAQALYQGQALTARLPRIRREMENAADEEADHLAWCDARLRDLESRPSLFNPLWYGLSFGLGAGAGMVSDRLSLGFVAATEEQVCRHLNSHLESLPAGDTRSRAVVTRMLEDENRHATRALEAGGLRFPRLVKGAMTLASRLMTRTSYRI